MWKSQRCRSYPIVELVDGESNEKDEDGDEGDRHPSVANVDGKVGQLGLQQGLGFCNKGSFFSNFHLKNRLLLVISTVPMFARRRRAASPLRLTWVGQRVVGMGVAHTLLQVCDTSEIKMWRQKAMVTLQQFHNFNSWVPFLSSQSTFKLWQFLLSNW